MRPVIATTTLRRGRVLVVTLALLAIAVALAYVAQDLSHRLPPWWSSQDALDQIDHRLGLPRAKPVTVLRDLPVHDRRGIDVLVTCLASPRDEVRRAARQVTNEHLDRWQLSDSDREAWLTEQLIQALLRANPGDSPGFQTEAAEIAQRALSSDSRSLHSESFVEACERLIRLPAVTETRATTVPGEYVKAIPDPADSGATPPADPPRRAPFEDRFALPGGGLPVTPPPRDTGP